MKKLLLVTLLLLSWTAWSQDRTVSGTVTSSDEQMGLPGVNVFVEGTTKGTTTDADGNYSLSLTDDENTLVFSFVGYLSQSVQVNDRTTIDVVLEADVTMLGEVVVVGYGTQRKVDITGSVAQVDGDDISMQPAVNALSGIQGKVAGVQITNSGAPGASPTIRIRGTGTIYGDANPLFVVDGVWYNDISFLNPSDIESMSVLKDASSQSIYGVRAANGVVLITTKKGSRDGATVTYDGYVGRQVVTNQIEMADGPQFAEMINELDEINGATGRYENPSSYGSTDWYRQILRSAPITSHQIGISGGSEKSTYNLSLGYLRQDGTVENNTFSRYNARLQNDFNPFEFLKLGYSVQGALNKSTDIDNGIFHQMYAAAPIVPVYYADGTYGDPNDFGVGSSNLFNPQVTLDFFNQKANTYRVTGNVYAEAKLGDYFTFRSSFGGDLLQRETRNYAPEYSATLSQRRTISKLTLTDDKERFWLLENTLSFDRTFGADHTIKVLVGQGAQERRVFKTIQSAENVPNSSEGDHYLGLGDNYFIQDRDPDWPKGYPLFDRIVSYFGRVNYSFKDKYLFTGSFRADGSSKFPDGSRWGNFPSVGLGWVISEEAFMDDVDFVTNVKLRGSWGRIGNVSVPANLQVSGASVLPQYVFVGGDGSTQVGANVSRQTPPAILWEFGEGIDVGLEASFLEDRLFFEADWYSRTTKDAIFAIPILSSLGTTSSDIYGNQASFENRGIEFLLRWNDEVNDNFNYSISANLGINENEVTEVSTGRNPIFQAVGTTGGEPNTRTVVGEPIGHFFGLQVLGIFQSDDDIASYQNSDGAAIQPNANPGDFKYQDTNGDGIIDRADRVILGNPNPKYTFGVNTTWGYRNFDFTLDFQGVAGVEVYNANLGFRFGTENFTKDFYDNRWQGPGSSNTYPSANIGGGQNYWSNSFYVEDGSYFRFRTIQLGYTLPASVVERFKISRLRVYANAQNALNFFSYRGFNPEIGGGPTRAGIDTNVYPMFATYNAGINLTF